ncbi:MAG: gliding motility-associated C-terminal domain-containing protein [Saprospiraceae bacterium]|nr:gliding motility-associated C-terminal domain-containing protein [Candidatus Vicinibacter affinis]
MKSNYAASCTARYMIKSLLVLMLMAITIPRILSQSNEGTEFWFSFLEHRDRGNARLCMISSKYNTSGTISLDAIGWSVNFNLQANTILTISIPPEAENFGSEFKANKGVRVVTKLPSSVYIHQYHEFRSDAALVLPVSSLGSEYYVMTYSGYQNNDDHYPSEFVIVATQNQTVLDLYFSADTRGGQKKLSTQQIILNEGETYQVQAARVTDDLSGTFVKGNKNFAVFSGNRWTQIPTGCGNRDNTLEQMYPIETWGKEFIAVPSKFVDYDLFRVLAAEDATEIVVQTYLPPSKQTIYLNKGQWREFRLNKQSAYIKSTRPIMLAQFLVGGNCNGLNGLGDPSMVLLNSIEQYRDTVTLFNSPYENIINNFINIIIQSRDSTKLTVDGKTIRQWGANFSTVGDSNQFAFVQLEVKDGPHTLISQGCGLIAVAYGYGQAESYAYGGGANFYKINQIPIPDGSCLTDSLLLKSGFPPSRFNVAWDLGDGTLSNLHEFKHRYKALGNYTVQLFVHDLCRNTFDTLDKKILISLRQGLTAYPDTTACLGSVINLHALDRDESTYLWNGPNGFSSDNQHPKLIITNVQQSGTYSVVSDYYGCESYPKELFIQVYENPIPDLGRDLYFCPEKESVILKTTFTSGLVWQDGSMKEEFIVEKGGLYSIQVTNEYQCVGNDTILIEERCPAEYFFPNIFSPNGDGINDLFVPKTVYLNNYKLQIFSRWGELLFSTEDPSIGWDGTANGQPMLPGVYIYLFSYTGYDTKYQVLQKTISGDLTLIR